MRIFLFIILVLFVYCKKFSSGGIVYKNPVLSYVISEKAIPIYSEPNRNSKILISKHIDSEITLLEHSILDSASEKIKWFKVSLGDKFGYLSELSLEKKEVVVFEKISPYSAKVTASNLRIRKSPSLTSATLTLVAQDSTLKVLEHGNKTELIDNRNDIWVKVELDNKTVGFCFKGFLDSGSSAEEGEEIISGYILLNSKEELKASLDEKSFPNMKETIPNNGIFPVSSKKSFEGKLYYKVYTQYSHCINNCESFELNFWASANTVEYSNQSLADFTYKKFGFNNQTVFEILKTSNPEFDVRNISVKSLGKKSDNEFILVELNLDTDWIKSRTNFFHKLFLNSKGNYSEILSEIDSYSSNAIQIKDFNNDGLFEVIAEINGRESSETVFYTIEKNKLVESLRLNSGMNYENEREMITSYEIKNDQIIYKETDNKSNKEKITKYGFKNNKFVKI